MTKQQKATIVTERLAAIYPEAICSLMYDAAKPYELLIATRLSAQCTDARVNIVTKKLFARYQSLQEFSDAKLCDVEKIVYPCGFYRVKASDIIAMSTMLLREYGGVLPDTIDGLVRLPGIGRKTANLVVGDIYGKPSIVTDTHCIRICGRLGLSTSKDPKKTEDELRKILDPAISGDFCHRLVIFGRDTCKSQSPRCADCPLSDLCDAIANSA